MVSIFTYRDERKLFTVIGTVIVAAVIALIQLDALKAGKPSPIATAVTSAAFLLQSAVAVTVGALRSGGDTLGNAPRLMADNRDLTSENRALRAQNANLREALAQAPDAAAIARAAAAAPGGIVANAIAYDPENLSRVVTIDRGEAAGVRLDAGVIDDDGVVGRIVAVDAFESSVLLVTDAGSKVPAVVQRGRWWGIAAGTNAHLALQYISQDAKLRIGDRVVTGLGRSFRAGLPIGRITRVVHPEGGLYQTAILEPAVAFGRLSQVVVLPHLWPEMTRKTLDDVVRTRAFWLAYKPGETSAPQYEAEPPPWWHVALALWVALLVQSTLSPILAFRGATVPFVLLVVAWYGVRSGTLRGFTFGLIAGACEDALAGTTGAAWTFSTGLVGLGFGRLARTWLADAPAVLVPGVAIMTLVRYGAFALILQFEGRPFAFALERLHAVVWQALLAALVAFFALRFWPELVHAHRR